MFYLTFTRVSNAASTSNIIAWQGGGSPVCQQINGNDFSTACGSDIYTVGGGGPSVVPAISWQDPDGVVTIPSYSGSGGAHCPPICQQ
jgi:hypothetical protein